MQLRELGHTQTNHCSSFPSLTPLAAILAPPSGIQEGSRRMEDFYTANECPLPLQCNFEETAVIINRNN